MVDIIIHDKRRDFQRVQDFDVSDTRDDDSVHESEIAVAEQLGVAPILPRGPLTEEEQTKTVPQFLHACGDRLIVREDPFKEPSKTIITPNTSKRRPTTGCILDIGPQCEMQWTVGERVVFGNFAGTPINFRNRPAYRILSEDEILAKVTKADEELEQVG